MARRIALGLLVLGAVGVVVYLAVETGVLSAASAAVAGGYVTGVV